MEMADFKASEEDSHCKRLADSAKEALGWTQYCNGLSLVDQLSHSMFYKKGI